MNLQFNRLLLLEVRSTITCYPGGALMSENQSNSQMPANVANTSSQNESEITSDQCPDISVITLDEETARSVGLPAGTTAETTTWKIPIWNWTDGVLSIRDIYITTVRANRPEGGYKCYITLTWNVWSTGWTTHYGSNPGVQVYARSLNKDNGLLFEWDLGRLDVLCSHQGHSMAFGPRDFSPDVYDLIEFQHLIGAPHSWMSC